jgi:hypothetical protein
MLLIASAASAQLRGPANQILIPAAGSVAGANGTFFRSEVTLTNFRDTDQRVQLQWLPTSSASPAPAPPAIFITIPARTGVASEDFITTYLQQAGLGAILITGVASTNGPDTGALLFATARIWSPQPGSTGTVSQSFPLIPVGSLKPGSQVIIMGQKIDSRYRTNVGVVNLDTVYTRTFDIVQSTDDPTFAAVQTTVTVAPMSMVQVKLQDFDSRSLQAVVMPRQVVQTLPGIPVVPDPTNQWVAYGSSVDNVTGDSWSNLAMPLLTP